MNTEAVQLIRRAREAFHRGDYVAALADSREVVERHTHFADVRNMMGLCLSFLGQPEAALEQFDHALDENDCYVEALLHRAITLNDLGRFEEARETFERTAECESRVEGRYPSAVSARLANAHSEVGDLYMAASAPADAVREYRKALSLRPSFHDIRNRLGQALMQTGALEDAIREFERALEGNGRFLKARLNLGLAHYRAGQPDRAREAWEECRSQDPNNPQVRAYVQLLDRGHEVGS